MGNRPQLSVDEIVNVLKRSFVPTILVEGTSDAFIYRNLKSSEVSRDRTTIISCGGRFSLIKVFERRSDYPDAKVVFVADRDCFRFDGVPDELSEIVFTTGYSIENDIYHESGCTDLLDSDDLNAFQALRQSVALWFAFEVEEHRRRSQRGLDSTVLAAKHINEVCPGQTTHICNDFKKKIQFSDPSPEVLAEMLDEYDLNIRGKQLFQILTRFLSRPGRFSQFSTNNLIELAIKTMPSPTFRDLSHRVEAAVAAQV
ncbi:MAG: DUF4435 domain-containing protein [Pseudomonadota bacterium]